MHGHVVQPARTCSPESDHYQKKKKKNDSKKPQQRNIVPKLAHHHLSPRHDTQGRIHYVYTGGGNHIICTLRVRYRGCKCSKRHSPGNQHHRHTLLKYFLLQRQTRLFAQRSTLPSLTAAPLLFTDIIHSQSASLFLITPTNFFPVFVMILLVALCT